MSRLAYLKEEENTLRSFLSKIQAQLDALAVEELALKSRIRRKRANMAKESNDKADVIVDAIQSNSLKLMQQPAVDVGFMNNELLDLEVNAPVFINKKEEETEEEESDTDDQMTAFIKMMCQN